MSRTIIALDFSNKEQVFRIFKTKFDVASICKNWYGINIRMWLRHC